MGHIFGPGQKAGKVGNLILDEPIIEASEIFTILWLSKNIVRLS